MEVAFRPALSLFCVFALFFFFCVSVILSRRTPTPLRAVYFCGLALSAAAAAGLPVVAAAAA